MHAEFYSIEDMNCTELLFNMNVEFAPIVGHSVCCNITRTTTRPFFIKVKYTVAMVDWVVCHSVPIDDKTMAILHIFLRKD